MLLSFYVFSLIVGGAFVLLAVFAGGADADVDIDVDVDIDMDLDLDLDLDADGGGGLDIQTSSRRRFNPLLSFKFYTFSLAFLGLTGTVFTLLNLMGETGTFIVSMLMGLLAGLAVSYLLYLADSGTSGRVIGEADYKGAIGRVVLPIGDGRRGKVRLEIQGRTVELLAIGEDSNITLGLNEECIILGLENGTARVVAMKALESWDDK